MKFMNSSSVILNLAGFKIKLASDQGTGFPCLSVRHAGLVNGGPEDFELQILKSSHTPILPAQSKHWQVPWSVHFNPPQVDLQGTYPGFGKSSWEMHLNFEEESGTLITHTSGQRIDPLQYPVDALLIYYLSLFSEALVIHASAVSFGTTGLAFLGRSGAGKSTIARFCQLAGARILHDDRIVLRCADDMLMAHRMPVYPGSMPLSMELNMLFFITKSVITYEIPQPAQTAFEKLACHTVQHPFDAEIIRRQISNLEKIARKVPSFILGFPLDPEIGHYLSERSRAGDRPTCH
jgi:hypothetical protein